MHHSGLCASAEKKTEGCRGQVKDEKEVRSIWYMTCDLKKLTFNQKKEGCRDQVKGTRKE